MSGTIPLSLTQQLDEFGQPLNGGKLYIIQAGTVSTPQNSFQDPNLTIALPNPITMDAAGRLPQFFLADGFIKIRLTDSAGIVQREADGIQVIGPSAGGGGGTPVDPHALVQMGNLIMRYGVGALAGYVRLNALTIGSATSGASERANADCQSLWIYLYGVDSTLAVSGGRSGNALNDWTANKTLTLPDGRNRLLMALADMGNSDIGLLAGVAFTKGNQLTLGSMLGVARRSIDTSILPSHYHTAGISDPGHSHSSNANINNAGGTIPGGGPFGVPTNGAATINAAATGIRVNSGNGLDTTNSTGGGAAFDIANPALLMTVYIKL
jgi:hypothetical protein